MSKVQHKDGICSMSANVFLIAHLQNTQIQYIFQKSVILDITTEPQDSTQNTTITNHKITNESCMSINDIFWAPKYLCTTIKHINNDTP